MGLGQVRDTDQVQSVTELSMRQVLQKKRFALILLTAFFCSTLLPIAYRLTRAPECPARRVRSITTIKESGGRVDWSPVNDLIVYDALQADGYYDLWIMTPEGGDERCLTCGQAGRLPQKHLGNPAWHPSGDYIVFQAEKETHPGLSESATPGFGLYSDLWLMSSDGQQFTRLTETPATHDSGVLHPHFSRDGAQLSWSEMYERPALGERGKEFGYWKLKVADFSLGADGPVLSNVREYEPGGPAFYENHGFSPNGDTLIFSSNFGRGGSVWQNTDIYTMNLTTLSVTQLTNAHYNEHAHYSPDGTHIVWMSDAEINGIGADYWLMSADGSNQERLTYFNRRGCPERTDERLTAADSSWGPDGNRLVAYISTDLLRQTGKIVMIEIEE